MMQATDKLNAIFSEYNIKATCVAFKKINHFNIYDIKLLSGCKISNVEKLANEIQLRLQSITKPNFLVKDGQIRMVIADKPQKISLEDLIYNKNGIKQTELILGIDTEGNTVVADLLKMPHCIVAGTTNSGKSVFLHTIIKNFLLTYREVDLILCDPKYVEFENYKNMKDNDSNICVDVANSYEDIMIKLDMLTQLMENRFKTLARLGYKNVAEYNSTHDNKFRYIVCIVDEFFDLITKDSSRKFENVICALASKSRAAGIHIILATQRPSVKAINGNIKANFATRICFKTSSRVDSLVVLDAIGGENLVGNGDCLMSYDGGMVRFQSAMAA